VSRSPVGKEKLNPTQQYIDAWSELAELIRQGRSFSGLERNCAFLNTRGPRFADVSTASGLDHIDDGRTVALVDWDHDGDLDLWYANRTGPRVRFLRNDVPTKHGAVAFRLVGDPSKRTPRDALGARVEVHLGDDLKLSRTLYGGDAYLSQSSKWIHFGLGKAEKIDKVIVRWPGDGTREEFRGISVGGRFVLSQGSGKAEPATKRARTPSLAAKTPSAPPLTEKARIRFAHRDSVPQLTFQTFDGNAVPVAGKGKPTLVNLWATWCVPCLKELKHFAKAEEEIKKSGLRIITLNVDGLQKKDGASVDPAARIKELGVNFPSGAATEQIVEALGAVQKMGVYRQRTLPLPSSYLIDGEGRLAVLYKGPVTVEQLLADVATIDATAKAALDNAVPFAGRWAREGFPSHDFAPKIASIYGEGGYFDDAVVYLESRLPAESEELRKAKDDASRQRASKRIADVRFEISNYALRAGDAAKSVTTLRSVLDDSPNDLRAVMTLARILAAFDDASVRDGAEAVRLAREACERTKFRNIDALDVYAAALAEVGRFDEAIKTIAQAMQGLRALGQNARIPEFQKRSQLYETGRPFRYDASGKPAN